MFNEPKCHRFSRSNLSPVNPVVQDEGPLSRTRREVWGATRARERLATYDHCSRSESGQIWLFGAI
jgi:hypothetical protein